MNNFLIISQILRSPWLIELGHGESYLQLAEQFLTGKGPALEEKSIQIQFVNQGVTVAKDYRNQTPIADTFRDVQPGTTAIIPINGVMTKYDVCGWYGMQSLAALVNAASREENISSIVLLMDTPGGSADGSLDLAEAVAAATANKPVIAYADGLLCSAGYRVAVRATSIVAKPGSIIGSIGTQITLRFNDAQLETYGIKEAVITADESPEKNADYLQAKDGNYKLIKDNTLNPLNTQFKNEVTTARPSISESALKGATYISNKALELQLIDSEGMLADAIALAENKSQNFSNNTFMSTPKITLGQKIRQFLGLADGSEQLTEAHAQSLEQLATEKETAEQAVKTHEHTIATQKTNIDAIQALFPGKTDLVAAVTEAHEKATKFDAADGGNQHRLDQNGSDGGNGSEQEKTLEQKLDELPHHQALKNNPFFK